MAGFLDKLVWRPRKEDVEIWVCSPLVIVHPVDGVVFADNVEVEHIPDQHRPFAGHTKMVGVSEDGWTPQLFYRQRIETLQTLDFRMRQRPGFILIGEDETAEPFTWYINGEADRYLTRPPETTSIPDYDRDGIEAILSAKVDHTKGEVQDLRWLHIVREDGWCPLSGPTQIRVSTVETPPVLQHLTSLSKGEDGAWPELYVISREPSGTGWTISGVDANGVPSTWYTDGAADEYLANLR